MPFRERCEILQGFGCVSDTTYVNDADNSVCAALRRLKPDYFANGGDRKTDNTPEMELCNELGIELVWNGGGGKIQSSSTLVSDSGMLVQSDNKIDGMDLTPSRVDIVSVGDVAKNGEY